MVNKTTNRSTSSVRCGIFSPVASSFTPSSRRSLLLRSSSLRLEDLQLRTKDRASQPLSDRLHTLSLDTQEKMWKCYYLIENYRSQTHGGITQWLVVLWESYACKPELKKLSIEGGQEYQPEYFQFTMWTLQSSAQHIHFFVLQAVITQVQFYETRGLRAKNWRQSFTTSLGQLAASQPETIFVRIVVRNNIPICMQ